MTDSMNFGPEWLRNLSSDGSTTGGTGGGVRYQLSGYRYGREEMLGLYEKGFKPPASLVNFTTLYTDMPLVPLVLTPTTEEERVWQSRPPPLNSSTRGSRGSSLERGGTRSNRGRGTYQYARATGGTYESGGTSGSGVNWGNGEQQEWSPRKDYNCYRSASVDNWRRNRTTDDDEGWRSTSNRGQPEKWSRSMSWRDGDKDDDRGGSHERTRNWHEGRGHLQRRVWDEDHQQQPEWFTEQLGEGGGTFDSSGAYHGSDDEQDHRGGRRELQKSASQQNISPRQPAPLTSSKSSISLSKQPETEIKQEKVEAPKKEVQDAKDRHDPPEKAKSEEKPHLAEPKLEEKTEKVENPPNLKIEPNAANVNINGIVTDQGPNRVEEDFDRLQEDLVSKLVVEEETPKAPMNPNLGIPGVGVTPQPPPNLVPPIQDKWFYQDPQGDLQGPFVSTEMAEWFKAGYFTLSLLVRRHCDKSFYTLGDLVRICSGSNPFMSTTRIPPLKEMAPVKLTEQDQMLNLQYLRAQIALQQSRPYKPVPTDWANLTNLQQRDMLTQHIMPVELQYFQQSAQPPSAAPHVMHIINQMQQVNKLPAQPLPEQPNAIPMQMDPLQALVQQMHSMQRMQPGNSALQGMGMPQAMPSENLINNMSNIHGNLSGPGLAGIPSTGGMPVIPQKPLENLTTPTDDNPINNLLRQLQNKNISQPPSALDALWQQNQFVTSQTQSPNQWQQPPSVQTPQSQSQQQPPPPPQPQPPQQSDTPISMWDLPPPPTLHTNTNQTTETTPPPAEEIQQSHPQNNVKEKEACLLALKKEKELAKEEKKRKEQEEKQLKKEVEEKRKQEQRRQEIEKKVAEEKKRKEEERIRKELEKARKEAEEKRLRELEEKRKLKEARKAEEEARKRAEEQKRLEEEQEKEKVKDEVKRVVARTIQDTQYKTSSVVKAAPWCQSNVATGPSLLAIQKAEREKRVEQAFLQQQQRQLQMQEQQTIEKASMQLSWATKPIQPRQVKSLAEIQAEEQELLAKQAAERLALQNKEKENNLVQVPTGIWQGQNLTWANTASQWSSNATGFWDDVPSQKVVPKPSNVVKSNSTSAMMTAPKPQQQPKAAKSKTKKDEVGPRNNGSTTTNGPATEEFTQWCIKALSNVTSTVDIPTFIGFLRDIESAAEVKDYCREYLGESQAMHQFTAQFLEKRRSFRPKTNAHKDDMCSPAPAITPSMQHNSDFQEVKGKGKKSKKSKMTKVDARILGFNVTAAQDRINVGDRDYGDN